MVDSTELVKAWCGSSSLDERIIADLQKWAKHRMVQPDEKGEKRTASYHFLRAPWEAEWQVAEICRRDEKFWAVGEDGDLRLLVPRLLRLRKGWHGKKAKKGTVQVVDLPKFRWAVVGDDPNADEQMEDEQDERVIIHRQERLKLATIIACVLYGCDYSTCTTRVGGKMRSGERETFAWKAVDAYYSNESTASALVSSWYAYFSRTLRGRTASCSVASRPPCEISNLRRSTSICLLGRRL